MTTKAEQKKRIHKTGWILLALGITFGAVNRIFQAFLTKLPIGPDKCDPSIYEIKLGSGEIAIPALFIVVAILCLSY